MTLATAFKQPAIADLSYLGLLQVSGMDAKKLLQGQLTCHLDEVTPTQFRLGAHCNPKGRIISLFQLFYWHDSYYLMMPKNMVTIALNALKKYAVFYKVHLHDASDELSILGYMGTSLDFMPSISQDTTNTVIDQNDYVLIQYPGKYIFIGAPAVIQSIRENQLKQVDYVSNDDWKYDDIIHHNAQIYPETSELFLPHELYLHEKNGVSFNKGCYTGQEIIARMQYRGKLKSALDIVKLDSIPARGKDLPLSKATTIDYCQLNNHFIALVLTSHQPSELTS